MSKVDDELTRRLQRAERPVTGDGLFEGLVARRSHRERLRRVQAGLVAFAVLAATAGGFVALREAFEPDDRGSAVSPSPGVLSANGVIVFTRDFGPDSSEHLFAVEPDGEGERQITSGPDLIYDDPAVSPDGATIVATYSDPSFLAYTPRYAIVRVPVAGGPTVRLTEPIPLASDPVWSPDGAMIAFAGMPSKVERRDIYVMNADGSALRRVAEVGGYELRDPAWSPDGRTLVFVGQVGGQVTDEPSDLFTVRLDGSAPINITQTPLISEWSPSWAPDGTVIGYGAGAQRGPNTIELIDPEGRPAGVVLDEGSDVGDLTWSPDGRWIAFTSVLALTVAGDEGLANVWTIRRDGSGLSNLTTDGARAVAWQPVPRATTPTPQPSLTPQPVGRDLGLGFLVCNIRTRELLDLGTYPSATAWTATRVAEGRCPPEVDGENLVAVDLGGDGTADDWAPLPICTFCDPTGAVDLNRDGVAELVIRMQGGDVANYTLYSVDGPASDRLRPISLWEYAGMPGFPSGEHVSLLAGKDEGFAASIECVETPERTYIVSTQLTVPVDAVDESEFRWVWTRLFLTDDGTLRVWDGETRGPDPEGPPPVEHIPFGCGLPLDPAASREIG
jgi:Tol biopolymer transport system component